MSRWIVPGVDGWEFTLDPSTSIAPGPGPGLGQRFAAPAQTDNLAASAVSDQTIGTIALPAINAGVFANVTITNALITAKSYVFCTVVEGPTADDGVMINIKVKKPVAGGVLVRYSPLVNMAQPAALWYLVMNG